MIATIRGAALFCLVAMTGCMGAAGEIPEEQPVYAFKASLAMTPQQPQAGTRLNYALNLRSASNRPVRTNLVLTTSSDDGRVINEQRWHDVVFHEEEIWDLSQGFLPDTSATQTKNWKVFLQIINKETGEVLHAETLTRFDFRI
jgi:hypothetical protein